MEIKGPGDNPWSIDFKSLKSLTEIGSGNFGKVYKAVLGEKTVAVKRLYDVDDEFMFKYIEREMALLKEMNHSRVVKFLGLSKTGAGDIFIITEFIPGGDLRKILKNKDINLGWKLRTSIAIDLASALDYLHSQGIIHRDVKSNNLLVDSDWSIKVCDFGFSRDIDANDFMTLCGTDEWMAPEVSLGEKYNEKADVFSFGMVMVELITRKKPPLRPAGRAFAFDAATFRAKEVPKDCPAEFLDVAMDCAIWDPEKRPSLKEIIARLKKFHNSLPDETKPDIFKKESESLANKLSYMSVQVEECSDDEEEDEDD